MSETPPAYGDTPAAQSFDALLNVLMLGSPEAAQGAYWQARVMWDERGEIVVKTLKENAEARERIERQHTTINRMATDFAVLQMAFSAAIEERDEARELLQQTMAEAEALREQLEQVMK
jgi:glutamate/tyrosine decarboxylase-like PLP-dependent enzyme